jgi:hypothetical protein
MGFNGAAHFVVATLAISCLLAPALATPEKDAAWDKLIADAVKRGGVETIMVKTASYVFAGPNGLNVTFARTLDNKVRAICAMYLNANVNVCMKWDTEKMNYATRASENAPWVVSDVPPDAPESAPETPLWLDLLSAFLDVDVPYSTFHSWHHGGGPLSARKGFTRAFSHSFVGGSVARHH